MAIGNIILDLRNEHNLSQKKLADALGVSQSAIAQIEVNRNEATAATIRKLADFFDVSADYLLEREDDYGVRTTTAAPSSTLTDKEQAMLSAFRQLLPETQDFVLRTAQSLKDKRDKLGAK